MFIWFIWFGGRCLKIRTFAWILNHISEAILWSLFALRASYLVVISQVTNLIMIFHVVVSIYRLVKI